MDATKGISRDPSTDHGLQHSQGYETLPPSTTRRKLFHVTPYSPIALRTVLSRESEETFKDVRTARQRQPRGTDEYLD
jgi:hypothetical protein